MSTLFKDQYSPRYFEGLSDILASRLPGFDRNAFQQAIFDADWEERELKDRMRHTAQVLGDFLPADFPEAARFLVDCLPTFRNHAKEQKNSLTYLFVPEYIERFGLDHFEASVEAMEEVTQFMSCELAVRPFLIRYEQPMLEQMYAWSHHEHDHVRRLSTEGCRPRLPWAMALPDFQKDPTPVLPILETLKADPSEFVRKSVANNLNDISKDHPDLVVDWARARKGVTPDTDWVLKHGCRTLLKQGHAGALDLFGLGYHTSLTCSDFRVETPEVQVGDDLVFSCTIKNTGDTERTLRLEYGIYYLLARGTHSRKVFKISEREFAPGQQEDILRKQSFRLITTRVFYPGQHYVSIIINGREMAKQPFTLRTV